MEFSVMEKKYGNHLHFNAQGEILFTWGYHCSLDFRHSNSVPHRGWQLSISLFSQTFGQNVMHWTGKFREFQLESSTDHVNKHICIYIVKAKISWSKYCQRHSMLMWCSLNPLDKFLTCHVHWEGMDFCSSNTTWFHFYSPSHKATEKKNKLSYGRNWIIALTLSKQIYPWLDNLQEFACIANF